MDQVAQSAIVGAVGNRTLKGRMCSLAQSAQSVTAVRKCRREQRFSADAAERPLEWAQHIEAAFTDRQAGNPNQRATTDTAVGGKKRKEQTGGSVFRPSGEPGTRCMTLRSAYSKPSTAEDGLPQPGEQLGPPPGYIAQV